MKFKSMSRLAAGCAAGTIVLSLVACAGAEGGASNAEANKDYTQMSAAELGEYLVMESGSFHLDMPTQEGTTARERMSQDELQKVCSETRNRPSGEQAGQISAAARETIQYPEDGIQLGDWERGGELSWGGFGYRLSEDNYDDHTRRAPDGACYNCHAMSTERTGGTIGPSLTGYGKTRGDTEDTRRFVYEVIYNPHAYFPCSNMPRMGANGILDPQAIADIMAYLLHPESPVNQ
ncbi:sulfur oxidation c-type cytochrome SoxX [Ectothiorhodospiraceae bacterium 2226]|nr:sulfur oxidation c-type cytochrome SoxX [Ectothiorhodospiraceae bacterium 2226]